MKKEEVVKLVDNLIESISRNIGMGYVTLTRMNRLKLVVRQYNVDTLKSTVLENKLKELENKEQYTNGYGGGARNNSSKEVISLLNEIKELL